MRTPHSIRAFAVVLALSACGKGEEPSESTSYVPPVQSNQTADTATGPGLKSLDEVRFHAFIGWDADLDKVVPPVFEGEGQRSAYYVTITDASGNWSEEESECQVRVDLEEYTPSLDAAPTYLWGLDIPQDPLSAFEDCIELGWDPAAFSEGGPLSDWAVYDWHIRIGTPPNQELIDWLTPENPPTDFNIDHYNGGTWWSEEAGLNGGDDDVYFRGYAMGPDYEIDFDSPLTRNDMVSGTGGLATGYYIMRMKVFWPLGDD